VPHGAAGVLVRILAHRCGTSVARPAARARTLAGKGRVGVRPTASTTYRAKVGTGASRALRVGVQPLITLRRLGRRRYSGRVFAARSFEARTAVFQVRHRRGWRRARRVALRRLRASTAPTIVSGATFHARVRGTVRVWLGRRAVGRCYDAAPSNAIRA
jgi:hypothetical protein